MFFLHQAAYERARERGERIESVKDRYSDSQVGKDRYSDSQVVGRDGGGRSGGKLKRDRVGCSHGVCKFKLSIQPKKIGSRCFY